MIAEQNYPVLNIGALDPKMNITLVQDGAGLQKLEGFFSRVEKVDGVFGFDTETDGSTKNDFWFRKARALQFGDKHEQYVIDLLAFLETAEKLEQTQGHYGQRAQALEPVFKVIRGPLCSNRFLKVGQNLPFEYEIMFWQFGMRIWNLYSTDIVERVIQAGAIHLKRYAEFSLKRLMERHFGVTIEKELQRSFNTRDPLTEEQILYAALDTRLPLPIRQKQMLILDKDKLRSTTLIENDALGTFTEMHIYGQNLHDEKWMERTRRVEQERVDDLKVLDKTFIPIVGRKDSAWDDVEIARLEKIWKENFEIATPEEGILATEARLEKDIYKKAALKAKLMGLKQERREAKAAARAAFSTLSKERTQKRNKLPKMEGEAFLNYGSSEQLLAALQKFPKMSKITGVGDDVLLKFNDNPMIQVLRRYRKGKKMTGTYGASWVNRWINSPCSEEGWRHPGDGRLHCKFNQLEAETGRTSVEKPNSQNLPQDDEVRACFICDPPDENIRISACCDDDTCKHNDGVYTCNTCSKLCETKAEEYCIVTCDMSGAELRIIAELAKAKSWIMAFAKDQDVHSVSCEILYPEQWPKLAQPGCAYYQKSEKDIVFPSGAVIKAGEPLRKKCDCKEHKKLRNETKSINFLLCYGGGPDALADQLGVTIDRAKELMKNHELKFPDVWGYLRRSGEDAKQFNEARDMYGRRRLLPEPTEETAREWFISYEEEKLELSDEDVERNYFLFREKNLREPKGDEKWELEHRYPTTKEIQQAYRAMQGSIGRRGKNHCIQGTNASIIKRAMGCGFDAKQKLPFLWHTLPQYRARFQNMVHDELVIHCPKRYGLKVKALVGDAFKRAAAEVMVMVVMEFEGHVAERWMK